MAVGHPGITNVEGALPVTSLPCRHIRFDGGRRRKTIEIVLPDMGDGDREAENRLYISIKCPPTPIQPQAGRELWGTQWLLRRLGESSDPLCSRCEDRRSSRLIDRILLLPHPTTNPLSTSHSLHLGFKSTFVYIPHLGTGDQKVYDPTPRVL